MTINVEQDWWDQLKNNLGDILVVIKDQMDLNHPAYQTPGNENSPMTGRTILEEINFLIKRKDRKIVRYLHATWMLATESYARNPRSIAGWSAICDLCSEEWALYPDEPENSAQNILENAQDKCQ